jgi:hypothetical protein
MHSIRKGYRNKYDNKAFAHVPLIILSQNIHDNKGYQFVAEAPTGALDLRLCRGIGAMRSTIPRGVLPVL